MTGGDLVVLQNKERYGPLCVLGRKNKEVHIFFWIGVWLNWIWNLKRDVSPYEGCCAEAGVLGVGSDIQSPLGSWLLGAQH